MNLKKKFEEGKSFDQFLASPDADKKLYRLHFERADIRPEDCLDDIVQGKIYVLCLTEAWCGDSLAILPVISRLVGACGLMELRILRRDENLDLMDRYLTKGGRAVPIFIFLDSAFDEIFHFGPRPAPAQEIFEMHRDALKEDKIEKLEVHKKIRRFYSSDRGRAIVSEVRGKLQQVLR